MIKHTASKFDSNPPPACGRAKRMSVALLSPLLASSFLATPALAVTIGSSPIVFPPGTTVQFRTVLSSSNCNFTTGAPVSSGLNPGCTNEDGSAAAGGVLKLNNQEDLNAKKVLLLSIQLTPAYAATLMPINGQDPTPTPFYAPPPPAPTVNLVAESWRPQAWTFWFEWTIFPQPASEGLVIDGFNVNINGVSTPLNLNAVTGVSLESHCPEPSTWMMLITGFGLVGWSRRRQRAGNRRRAALMTVDASLVEGQPAR